MYITHNHVIPAMHPVCSSDPLLKIRMKGKRARDGVGWGVIWCCLRVGWSGEGVMGENNIIMIGRWHNYLVRDEKQSVRGKKWIAQTAYGIKGRKHRKIERRGVIKDCWYSSGSLWLVYEADGKHCSLYLLKNDERVQMRKEGRLCTVGWKTLG